MSKVIANTYRHSGASADAITLDSSGNVTFNGTVTGDNNTIYDDSNLRRDLNTLALQTAVDTNRKAYNLTNSFIDQFEDDTGIGTETNVNRNTDNECVVSETSTDVNYAFNTSGTHGHVDIRRFHNFNSYDSDQWTQDRILEHTSTGKYITGVPDFAFDLSGDFESYIWYRVDSNGATHNIGFQAYAFFVLPTTSISTGKNPTYGGNEIWSIDRAYWDSNTPNGSAGSYAGHITETEVEQSRIFSDDVRDHIGQLYYPGNTTGTGNTTLNWATGGNDNMRNNGFFKGHYYNSGSSHTSAHGSRITYDKSANTLTVGFATAGGSTGLMSEGKYTITNLPTSGRVIHIGGSACGETGRYMSLSQTGGSNLASSGTISTVTTSATGTVVGAANTASSSRTKVSGTFLYKNASGTATIGTDLKIYFTCNGGTNWTEAASYTVGSDFSTGIKTIYLGETTCTAGTDVRYKAVWANQASGSKVTELHGIGVNY